MKYAILDFTGVVLLYYYMSLFHQIMVAVVRITESIIYSKTSKQKREKKLN